MFNIVEYYVKTNKLSLKQNAPSYSSSFMISEAVVFRQQTFGFRFFFYYIYKK